ncbi:MAG: DUF2878 domain-containing protein [Planctomycetota bacterium]
MPEFENPSKLPRYPLINLVLFHVGWVACIAGAANGVPWVGVGTVVILVAIHVAQSKRPQLELGLAVFAAALGYGFDSALVLLGAFEFPEPAQLGAPSTVWMAAMWANFATTLTSSLGWMRGRLPLAFVFGLVGGPVSYFGGHKWGAIQLENVISIPVGIEWAIAFPLLVGIAARSTKSPSN